MVWGIVFCDVGSSIYYTPGIIFSQVGDRAALFVGMTLVVFALLVIKYAEVTWRYPEGGGVVTVASRAIHPYVGFLGGLFILVDYFLTAAISALSGLIYFSVVMPALGGNVVIPATIITLGLLAALNLYGIKESARVSLGIASLAALGQVLVMVVVALHLGLGGIGHSFTLLGHGVKLPPTVLLTGFAGAFLAFSGLESVSQLAPALRSPRKQVATRAMLLVLMTVGITSPLLTLWSTTLARPGEDPNQFISLLGGQFGGNWLAAYVALSGSALLLFAANTAIIGTYHVFLALTRQGFLPKVLDARNRLRGTPHWAIGLAAGVPIALVALTTGQLNLLGDLYAFGLLGAFTLTCLALDLVRHREHVHSKPGLVKTVVFYLGLATTLAVAVAWTTNLFTKPLATVFGGALTLTGLAVGLVTLRYKSRHNQPTVFPIPYSPQAMGPLMKQLGLTEVAVLAFLPHDPEFANAVVDEAVRVAKGKVSVFVYQSDPDKHKVVEGFLEIADPYLHDRTAWEIFAKAEMAAREGVRVRRYLYVAGNLSRTSLGEIWQQLKPMETVLLDGERQMLPALAITRASQHYQHGICVLHLHRSRREGDERRMRDVAPAFERRGQAEAEEEEERAPGGNLGLGRIVVDDEDRRT